MTSDEYSELVAFIGGRFDQVDRRFDQVDRRFEGVDARFDRVEERLTRVEVFAEENRHLIQTVAEGVTAANRRIDDLRAEVDERFRDLRSEMRASSRALRAEMRLGFQEQGEAFAASHADLDRRVTALEEGVDGPEEERV